MRSCTCCGCAATSIPSTAREPASAQQQARSQSHQSRLAGSVRTDERREFAGSGLAAIPQSSAQMGGSPLRENRLVSVFATTAGAGAISTFICRCPCAADPPLPAVRRQRVSQWQMHGGRHPQAQLILRIGHEHADFVDQARTQFGGLHRLRGEFRNRRDEPYPSGETAVGERIDRDRRGLAFPYRAEDPVSATYTRTHFGSVIARVKADFCGEAISPGSTMRERTTALRGASRSASLNCCCTQRELCLIGAQLSFRLRNVFLARADLFERQRLAIDRQPRLRHIERGLGGIHLLPADAAAGRAVG